MMAVSHTTDLRRRDLLQLGCACALGLAQVRLPSHAQPVAETPPQLPEELRNELPDAKAVGAATLRFLGLDIYRARLWAGSGFQAANYAHQPFGLELNYFRSLSGKLIAERSLKEMRRQGKLSEEREQAWLAAMVQAFPDVKTGDRITGLHSPGAATHFWFNGQSRPAVRDPEFGPVFFGIWLSDATSEPGMRATLLGKPAP